MTIESFYLAEPISAGDQVRACNLDLYGLSDHPPHAWMELKEHRRIITGYRCLGRGWSSVFAAWGVDDALVIKPAIPFVITNG